MYKDEETAAREPRCGNENFKGYCVELAREVAHIVNFTYEICVVKDKMYGTKLKNGTWNGMIGELTREVSHSMPVLTFTLSTRRGHNIHYNMANNFR